MGVTVDHNQIVPFRINVLPQKLFYQANVTNNSNNDEKFYRVLAETPFKDRFRNHTKEFKHKKYYKNTELSKYIWQLKESDISPEISWEIIDQVYSNTRINFCVLCLTEKLKIIDVFDDSRFSNKKSELVNACHDGKINYC